MTDRFTIQDAARSMPGRLAEEGERFSDRQTLLPLPERRRRSNWAGLLIFFVAVAVGMVGTVYVLFELTPRYVTEVHFTVSETASGQETSAAGQAGPAPAVGMGIAAVGGSAFADTFMVSEYLRSPSVVDALRKDMNLRAMFDSPAIDPLSRFNPKGSEEALTAYFQNRVQVSFDPITSTASFTVDAFTPANSYNLARQILNQANNEVNEMDHGEDLAIVGYARNEVNEALQQLQALKLSLGEQGAGGENPGSYDGFVSSRKFAIELQFAEQSYSNALTNLQVAQQTAAQSQRYLVVFVPPVMPTAPTRPVIWMTLLSIWFYCLTAAAIIGLIIAAIRERLG